MWRFTHVRAQGPGPRRGAAVGGSRTPVFDRLGRTTDRPVADIEREFRRKRRYVEHLVKEGYDDFEGLFGFLADLRSNEAATVERVRDRQKQSVAADGVGTQDAEP